MSLDLNPSMSGTGDPLMCVTFQDLGDSPVFLIKYPRYNQHPGFWYTMGNFGFVIADY